MNEKLRSGLLRTPSAIRAAASGPENDGGGGPDTHDRAPDAKPSGHVGWHGVGVGGLRQIRAVHVAQRETRAAAVRAVMTSWPFNYPAAVLQSALECIEKRRARAAGAASDASPPEDNDDPPAGKGREEFENFDPSRDDVNEDEASPSRRQRRDEGHCQHGLRQPPEGLPHGATKDATGAERDGPDTHMAGPDDAAEREGPGDPAPTAPERGASDDSTAEQRPRRRRRSNAQCSRPREQSRKGTSRQRTA